MSKSTPKYIAHIYAKCSDLCDVTLIKNGKVAAEHDGYVPEILSSDSDAIVMEIDLLTGRILNWKPPTEKQIANFIAECNDEEDDDDDEDDFDQEAFDRATGLTGEPVANDGFYVTLCGDCAAVAKLKDPGPIDPCTWCDVCSESGADPKVCRRYEVNP